MVSRLLKDQASLLSFEMGLASGLKDESVSDVGKSVDPQRCVHASKKRGTSRSEVFGNLR